MTDKKTMHIIYTCTTYTDVLYWLDNCQFHIAGEAGETWSPKWPLGFISVSSCFGQVAAPFQEEWRPQEMRSKNAPAWHNDNTTKGHELRVPLCRKICSLSVFGSKKHPTLQLFQSESNLSDSATDPAWLTLQPEALWSSRLCDGRSSSVSFETGESSGRFGPLRTGECLFFWSTKLKTSPK